MYTLYCWFYLAATFFICSICTHCINDVVNESVYGVYISDVVNKSVDGFCSDVFNTLVRECLNELVNVLLNKIV